MKIGRILKNVIISIIIGVLLGIVTEYALILNINWLIKITQTFRFWAVIICIIAFFSKDYLFSLMNPSIVMTLMNATYYMIRLIISGYTNIGGLEMFTLTGISGSMYLGTIVFLIREKFFRKNKNIIQKNSLICMSTSGVLFTILGFYTIIRNNLFYNIDIGIIIGFIIGLISTMFLKKKKINDN